MIIHRPCYTVKDCDKNWRTWNNFTAQTVEAEFRNKFPNHNVGYGIISLNDFYLLPCMLYISELLFCSMPCRRVIVPLDFAIFLLLLLLLCFVLSEHFLLLFILSLIFYQVILLNSHDSYWTNCMTCQIRMYANTDILIGLHGAGLTNIIFMPPNSLVVELAAQFDGRMQPLCGYHGPLAGISSLYFCKYCSFSF